MSACRSALHGIQPEIDRNPSFYNSLRYDHERKPLSEVIRPTNFPNLNIVPANLELQEYEYDTPIAIQNTASNDMMSSICG
jgi:chromosome partitioning protein